MLGVGEPDVGDDADIRARDVAQQRKVTATRSPISVTITRAGAGVLHNVIGKPELVVVRRDVRVAAQRRQHRREQILGRRLPGRARDRDDVRDRRARRGAIGRHVLQRGERVADAARARGPARERRSPAIAWSTIATWAPASNASRTKSWPSRESRNATKHAPASSARESNAHVVDARVRIAARLRRRHAARSRPRSSRSYARLELFARDDTIVEGRGHAADRLAGLVTLPGDHDDVTGARLVAARRESRRRRSSSTRGATRSGPHAREHVAMRSRPGPRSAGCRWSRTATSPRRVATSPITGRLARSRSPPQPNTTSTRPPGAVERARRLRARSEARRACARSRRAP